MSERNAWRGSSGETPSEPYDVGHGNMLGRVFWIRNEPDLQVGIWSVTQDDVRTPPAPYVFTGDETILVLQGEIEIDVEPDAKVHLRTGDIASFKKGATSQWNVISDEYKEVFIYAGRLSHGPDTAHRDDRLLQSASVRRPTVRHLWSLRDRAGGQYVHHCRLKL